MLKSTLVATVAIAALMAFAPPVLAQTQPDPHHPPAASTTPPKNPRAATAPASKPASPASSKMKMQGGDMPMMGMMASMMRQGSMAMSEMAMPGMDMADRVEGRIAFLRAELKITESQAGAWDGFATALRDNAKTLGGMRAKMGPQSATATLAGRLEHQEHWYAARLDGIRALKTTFARLSDVLSDEQKKITDEIAAPHLGLMPAGAAPMGMMSMGGPSAAGTQMGRKP